MSYMRYMTNGIDCIEVCSTRGDGKLVGYAIFFSGGWDAWVVSPYDSKTMLQLAGNLRSAEPATEQIKRFAEHGYGAYEELKARNNRTI